MRGYSFGDTLKNAIFFIYTHIFWHGARLVRLPILARNRHNISYGHGLTCGVNCRINPGTNGKISIGDNFTMGDQCQIEAMSSVFIGDNTLLASKIYIGDSTHGSYSGELQSSPDSPPNERIVTAKPIIIGNNVWIGNGATILGGVEIGDGCVIGANAVVTHSIPKKSIAVGNPARVIKQYDDVNKEWKRI